MENLELFNNNKNDTKKINEHLGKKIDEICMKDYIFTIKFTDGSRLEFKDVGQSCCERRYMTCDDNVDEFRNSIFNGASIRNGDGLDTESSDFHDIEFILIHTNNGDITVANHNEHNGYYGGFNITVKSK